MPECERREICGFFNNRLTVMPPMPKALRKEFCHLDKESCARYMVHDQLRQGLASPADEATAQAIEQRMLTLFPNDSEKAQRIIEMLQQ